MLATIATLWAAVERFSESLAIERTEQFGWYHVKKQISQLQDLSNHCNRLIGHLIGLLLLEMVVSQATLAFLFDFTNLSDVIYFILDIQYLMTQLVIVVLAASIPEKVINIDVNTLRGIERKEVYMCFQKHNLI